MLSYIWRTSFVGQGIWQVFEYSISTDNLLEQGEMGSPVFFLLQNEMKWNPNPNPKAKTFTKHANVKKN